MTASTAKSERRRWRAQTAGAGARRLAPVPALTAFTALTALALLALAPRAPESADEPFARERERLLAEIRETVDLTSARTGRARLDPRVMETLRRVPRHEFVPPGVRDAAWENRPLPIGHGQTISQPYIVALMTDLLATGPGDVVLEVGTGSGYQAAVLAELVGQVYTIEIVPPLARSARARLDRLGYENVTVRGGDGYHGWPEHAPYDGIVVTAAASHVPPPLVAQLRPGARMVIPVGSRFSVQQLLLVEKTPAGEVRTRHVLPVRFVPLTGGH